MHYFVTAIGTDSGKTVVSAILAEALQYDYWKPIQCGAPRDTEMVRSLLTNTTSIVHEEGIFLQKPASPHDAARAEGREIYIHDVEKAYFKRTKPTIIEGAGGALVPINDDEFIIDIPQRWDIPLIVVANLYLGSINHTLLTLRELQHRNLTIKGIVMNGPANPESERIIFHHSGCRKLLHLQPEEAMTKEVVQRYAAELKKNWNE